MMQLILGKLGMNQNRHGQARSIDAQANYSLDRLKTLAEFFPIGRKVRYYPEFKKDVVFETLIIAYFVNRSYIYTGKGLERDGQGYVTGFVAGDRALSIPIAELDEFSLLVPDTSHMETTLDYDRRAMIGRGRQFSTGNSITLIGSQGGKLATLDTEVSKRLKMTDGPYAQAKMILLTPDLNALSVSDQRRIARAKASTPVTLSLAGSDVSAPCSIVDIADTEVQIRVRDSYAALPDLQCGDEVQIDIDLGGPDRRYRAKGSTIRCTRDACVIKLKGIRKTGGSFSTDPLDFLELKAGILNYVD